ncbi:hypothetical protein NMY22_g1669 [Coprinellus aureogranulatus]|nr:hypothetical protein NMY22_g1669 [Coprinellus aureogranulatus]
MTSNSGSTAPVDGNPSKGGGLSPPPSSPGFQPDRMPTPLPWTDLSAQDLFDYLATSQKMASGMKMNVDDTDGHYGNFSIPVLFRGELETLTTQVVKAWDNRVKLEFSLIEVSQALRSSGSKVRDQHLREQFASAYPRTADGSFPIEDEPTVFLDRNDLVVAWYIPGAFSCERSLVLMRAVERYGESVLTLGGDKWRVNQDSFATREKCVVPPGNANFSICWYSQGHGPYTSLPRPSANLKTPDGQALLGCIKANLILMGVLLSVIHPDYYNQQMDMFIEIFRHPEDHTADPELMRKLSREWYSPFDAFALISNRETELHRDNRGGMFCLDLLGTFGRYTGGRLEVPLLGRRFLYNPGTAFAMPGYLFEHGASRVDGERICVANFFRPTVCQGVFGEEWKDIHPPSAKSLKEAWGLRRPDVDVRHIWD